MKRIYCKRLRPVIIIALLLAASILYSVNLNYHSAVSDVTFSRVVDNLSIDDTDIEILFINLKNLLMFFSKFIISLVLPALLINKLIMDRSMAFSELPSIIMHFLQLKDGKKDAPSY